MAEYIEKQAAIDEVKEWYDLYPDSDAAREALSFLKRFIKKLPPADVRPVVRGRWVKLYEDPLDGSFYCSNCKGEIDIADGGDTPLNRGLYYCHNCGADMRGSDVE